MTCTSCSRAVPDGSLFCPHCGASTNPGAFDATRSAASDSDPGFPAPSVGVAGRDSPDHGRFLPGTMFGGRYRVVGLLGRGGMGEVYRADDLKLGQSVALKFLPAVAEKDRDRLRRFLNEVKIARQISHPNVCRMYDVGEVDGHHYLSMEYVDGEDLSSLLRRIGRLPKDKAVQISRQLCLGLAAAHEQGILHRDLKPENVMIDGRGRAKITDFGLAALAGTVSADEVSAGTPLYMAPEQRAGKDVTVRSEIYSLGLVMYELFTGQPAFKATTAAELARLQAESSPTDPTRLVEGLDPMVERAILRCLEKEPADRPASALLVAASLPGGDPLAAALAAGETPSPEVVAAAGGEGGLAPWVAWAFLAAAIVAFAAIMFVTTGRQVTDFVPLEKSPPVLEARAKELVRKFGYTDPPWDSQFGFAFSDSGLHWIEGKAASSGRASALSSGRLPAVSFFYLQGPAYLSRSDPSEVWSDATDPPMTTPGMIRLTLDTDGRLLTFRAVPAPFDGAEHRATDPDWTPFFEAADLNPGKLREVSSTRVPRDFADRRVAWSGTIPLAGSGRSPANAPTNLSPSQVLELPVRIEASSLNGRPIHFAVIFPWEETRNPAAVAPSAWARFAWLAPRACLFLAIIGGAVLARRNLRLGQGHRKGAFRLAALVFVLSLALWLSAVHHTGSVDEYRTLVGVMGGASWIGLGLWIFYVAIEPLMRRFWPRQIVAWVRLLDGRFRDPGVGKEVLVGAALGLCMVAIDRILRASAEGAGAGNDVALWCNPHTLEGPRFIVGVCLTEMTNALFGALFATIGLVATRFLVGNAGLAVAVFFVIYVEVAGGGASLYPGFVVQLILTAIFFVGLLRYGFLAIVVATFVANLMDQLSLTPDVFSWNGQGAAVGIVIVGTLVAYGFKISLAGRRAPGEAP
jgi:predicted Ser/Thr protein kinase